MPINSHHSSNWLLRPSPGHLVQFYPTDLSLLSNLTEYIAGGLRNHETCIVIAAPLHLAKLTLRLSREFPEIDDMENFISLDAAQQLKNFMINGLPSPTLFNKYIGEFVRQYSQTKKPVRAYGEMVALLWKAGNEEAVMQLEALWNNLLNTDKFSLFCGYPDLHFVYDTPSKNEILHMHDINVRNFQQVV